MWKKKDFEYDGTKYYDYKNYANGTLRGTLVRIPYRKNLDKYFIWDRSGKTISVQYFKTLQEAKKYAESIL